MTARHQCIGTITLGDAKIEVSGASLRELRSTLRYLLVNLGCQQKSLSSRAVRKRESRKAFETRIGELKRKLPNLEMELWCLQRLMSVDVPSVLNKIRFITEKVLYGLCLRSGVSWGQGEPTLERMLGPLVAAGVLPKSVAIHVRTVQTNTSPGSHYQECSLSRSHVEIALFALFELLEWLTTLAPGNVVKQPVA